MIYKNFGQTEKRIPAIGFGMCINELKSSSTYIDLERVLHECIDSGATFFDTSPVYGDGKSENMLGRLFYKKRNNIFLATKFSPENARYKEVIKSAEQSLKRLRTDNIDLYQIHWPNLDVPVTETLSAMEKLVNDGKVKQIGVSNFSLKQLQEVCSYASINIASIQVEYNLFDRSIEQNLLPFCRENKIAVIGYSPLIQGRLANGHPQIKMLENVAKKYNATSAQIVLRWLTDNPEVFVIPNTTKKSRIFENLRATDINLSEEDKKYISDNLKTIPQLVDLKKIRVSSEYNKKAYTNIEEAIENKMNLSPSPLELSRQMKSGEFLKTIRLRKLSIPIENKEYDLVEGRLRYWAWVLAYGWFKPIPALIWNNEEKNHVQ